MEDVMARIIAKRQDREYEIECPTCKSLIGYKEKDLKKYKEKVDECWRFHPVIGDDPYKDKEMFEIITYVRCPLCKNKIIRNKKTIYGD